MRESATDAQITEAAMFDFADLLTLGGLSTQSVRSAGSSKCRPPAPKEPGAQGLVRHSDHVPGPQALGADPAGLPGPSSLYRRSEQAVS